jgi:hypothetical protein
VLPESVAVANEPIEAVNPQAIDPLGLLTVAEIAWFVPAFMLELLSEMEAEGIGPELPPLELPPPQPVVKIEAPQSSATLKVR